ncbi:MAG: small multi-drug export protein [Clostridia bacterium]|nr:small multi-drug export protein [Clostridia bacterium]MBR2721259.1 small multi-drug export protein [Clostridia bacterium]
MGIVEVIEEFFLETVGKELCVFFCSAIPIIECRGAVPMGTALGLPWWQTALFSFVGNILPAPFILLFIRSVLKWFASSKIKFFRSLEEWLNRKVEKHKGKIEKYSYWGILLFVGIPLPGTGAWTGTLIASVLGLEFKKSLLATAGGVSLAILIMMTGSYVVKFIVGLF